ncbi:MAG: hypothetical protein ABF293_07070 [Flavobacteriaceae bacterium]
MKSNRINRTTTAVGVGITGGLIFLLFYYSFIGLAIDDLYLIAGLFGSVLLTSIAFLLLNSK